MSRLVTINDIAKELQTTPATVSRALNNHRSISEAKKKLIVETAEKMNYRRNTVASSLRLGHTKVLGVIIPSAEINFFGRVVHGIESKASLSGYNVIIFQSNELRDYEVRGIETLLSARVDGIMVSIAKDTAEYSHFLLAKNSKTPIVFFDRVNDDLGINSVTVNDNHGAYLATQHLIDQGYRRIAHISGPHHMKIFNDRLKGYMGALQANNIKVDFDLIMHGNVSVEAGRDAISRFMKLDNPPDAVFAVEDFTALGSVKELKDRQIRIPHEFGVIGFANEAFGEHITPTLSTIDQQTIQMGEEVFDLMMYQISNKNAKEQKKIVLNPLPVFRESSIRRGLYN